MSIIDFATKTREGKWKIIFFAILNPFVSFFSLDDSSIHQLCVRSTGYDHSAVHTHAITHNHPFFSRARNGTFFITRVLTPPHTHPPPNDIRLPTLETLLTASEGAKLRERGKMPNHHLRMWICVRVVCCCCCCLYTHIEGTTMMLLQFPSGKIAAAFFLSLAFCIFAFIIHYIFLSVVEEENCVYFLDILSFVLLPVHTHTTCGMSKYGEELNFPYQRTPSVFFFDCKFWQVFLSIHSSL